MAVQYLMCLTIPVVSLGGLVQADPVVFSCVVFFSYSAACIQDCLWVPASCLLSVPAF